MKRWGPWLLVVLGLCALVFAGRSESPGLLADTDTAVLLRGLREESDPMVWFKGDWPLKNHFYRPISTLAFYFDYVASGAPSEGWELTGSHAAVFGRTNAAFAILSIMLLFWFLREATDSSWLTGVATSVFALWHFTGWPFQKLALVLTWLAPLCLLGVMRGGRTKVWPCVLAACACGFMATQLMPVEDFSARIVEWLPGRTASVMTVFALLSLASYARIVRTTAKRVMPEASAEDVPATKSFSVSRAGWVEVVGLFVLCIVGLVLALGSYEQAVMLPALLFGVWLMFSLRGMRSPWWPHVVFWLLLVGYIILRVNLVPSEVSGYQDQQFRSGPGVWIVLGSYVFPAAYGLYLLWGTFAAGPFVVMTGSFWTPLVVFLGNVGAYWRGWVSRESRWFIVGFFLLAFVAFLPMAWLKPFGHYHYLPSALRAPFLVLLGVAVFRLVASAASLPELQAPARRDPAPGSLLRP